MAQGHRIALTQVNSFLRLAILTWIKAERPLSAML
jgi:hypothetical protein